MLNLVNNAIKFTSVGEVKLIVAPAYGTRVACPLQLTAVLTMHSST
jgi:signal transduction histidine kinase